MPAILTSRYVDVLPSRCCLSRLAGIGVRRQLWGTLWGTWARAPSSTSNCVIFQLTSEPHNLHILRHLTLSGCLPRNNILDCSSASGADYCINFIIFLYVTLKLFSLSFMPLLAPNPGDATSRIMSAPGTYPQVVWGVCPQICYLLFPKK